MMLLNMFVKNYFNENYAKVKMMNEMLIFIYFKKII